MKTLRVQRKLILQLTLLASCNQHLLAQKSFLLAGKKHFSQVFFNFYFSFMHPVWHVMWYLIFHFVRATFGPQEFIRNLKHLSYSTFVILILRKIFACPWGKLSTEFTNRIAKSTSPGLSDTTFFARWEHTCHPARLEERPFRVFRVQWFVSTVFRVHPSTSYRMHPETTRNDAPATTNKQTEWRFDTIQNIKD